MARTLAAMTDSVYQQLEGGQANDDSRLPYDLVRDKVLKKSWAIIGKYYSKWLGQLPDVLYQQCCIEVACESICDSPVTRLVGTLPGIMGTLDGREIRYVGTVQGRAFSRTTTRTQYESFQPFAGKDAPSFRITGDIIEVINAPIGIEVIMVEAIFADPTACKLCVDDDQLVVPLSPELIDQVEIECIRDLSQWWKQFRPDKRNDATTTT